MTIQTVERSAELKLLLEGVDSFDSWSWSDLPSSLSIISLRQTARVCRFIKISYASKDFEGILLNILRISKIIFGSLGAISSDSKYCNYIWHYLSPAILHFLVPINLIIGLAHCGVEALSETVCLARQIQFYYSPMMRLFRTVEKIEHTSEKDRIWAIQNLINKIFALDEKDLTKDSRSFVMICLKVADESLQSKTSINTQNFLHLCAISRQISSQILRQKYLNPKNEISIVKLARRVGTSTLTEIDLKLTNFEINGNNALNIQEKDLLFRPLSQQAGKRICIHLIGLIAVAVTIVGISLFLFSGSLFLFAVLYAVGFTLSFLRHIISLGVMNEENRWQFRPMRCLTNC